MMRNKALRLPIILLAFLVMAGIIQGLRPKAPLEPQAFRNASEVEKFDYRYVPNNVIVNGHNATELINLFDPYTPLSLQQSWSPTDIKRIEASGHRQILVFTDDSTREVTPALLKQLPGSIQVRLNYDRNN